MEHQCFQRSHAELEKKKDELIELAMYRFKGGGTIYSLDLVSVGLIDRTISTIDAFIGLQIKKNYSAATMLLRAQIDTLLRASGLYLVSDLGQACEELLSGKAYKNMQDVDGKKLRDWYLLQKLAEKEPWLKAVYDRSCGFTHFSKSNIMAVFGEVSQDGMTELVIGAGGAELPKALFDESAAAFLHVTLLVHHYIAYLPNFQSIEDREI